MNVDINKSFKHLNPIYCLTTGIEELYIHTTEEEADKTMWSIFMYEYPDPKKNVKAKLPKNQRLEDIKATYHQSFDPSDMFVKAAMIGFAKHCISFEANMYRIQANKLDELTAYFEELQLKDDKDFDRYMKISDKLGKIWSNFDDVKKKYLSKEKETQEKEGGGKISKAEQRRNNRK